MSNNETKLYFSGIPTQPEVTVLMGLLDNRGDGHVIEWAEIEHLIGSRTGEVQRVQGIIGAWKRRAYRERNVLLVSVRGEGYRIADPVERVEVSSSLVSQGRRRIVKGSIFASTTAVKGLNEEQRRTREHLIGLPNLLKLAELTAPKPFVE